MSGDLAATRTPLPSRHAVRTFIGDLIGRPVELRDGEPVPLEGDSLVAAYVTDKLALAAVAAVDLPGAARLGGALGMLPRGAVDDAIEAHELDEMLRDCCYEVLNVLAAAFNVPDAPHVRLYELHGPDVPPPPDVVTLVTTMAERMDVTLSIAGYGDGRISIVVR